jgi:Zn finger protein HypA/HybF involved in hydrogenase expression
MTMIKLCSTGENTYFIKSIFFQDAKKHLRAKASSVVKKAKSLSKCHKCNSYFQKQEMASHVDKCKPFVLRVPKKVNEFFRLIEARIWLTASIDRPLKCRKIT